MRYCSNHHQTRPTPSPNMRFTFLFYFIIISFTSYGQSISGKILDDQNLPIPFVNVAILTLPDSALYKVTTADTSGNFSIQVEKETYIIKVKYFGFEDYQSEKLDLSNGNDLILDDVILKEETNLLKEAEVVAQKPLIQKTTRGMVVNVESSPLLSGGSTKAALSKVPGIQIRQDGSLSLKGRDNVVIYMDGKRSYMNMEQLMLYLEGLPASDIEKIEIYDTPPAKFDAEGDAGVINVILKEGAALGTNGMIGANLGYGTYHKAVPWGNFNHRRAKFNVFGNGWAFNNKTFNRQEYVSEIPLDGTTTFLDSKARTTMTPNGFGGRIGLDLFLNKKNTLGFLVNGYNGIFQAHEISTNLLSGDNTNPYDSVATTNKRAFPWWGHGYNINYVHKFKDDQSLSADVDFAYQPWAQRQSSQNQRFAGDTLFNQDAVEVDGFTGTYISTAKVDYEMPISKNWELELGAKTSIVKTDNDITQLIGTETNNLVLDSGGTTHFIYDENINAAYGIITGKVKQKWNFDLGLRIENTNSTGYSQTLNQTNQRNYLDFFPNVGLKYSINDKIDLSGSYARRIQRPEYWQLNPYEIRNTQFRYDVGNPQLAPQYTNAFSLGFSYESAAFVTMTYNHTTDAMTQVVEQDESLQRTYYSTQNLDDIYNYGINLTSPIPIKDWWTINLTSSAFYNLQRSRFTEGNINNALWSYSFDVRNYFTLPKDFKIEIGGFYNSPVFWNTTYVGNQYELSVGVSKEIKRFNINLSYQDFLNLRESNGYVRQGDVDFNYYYKEETRAAYLSISYRFGNNKVKGVRERKTGSEDLKERSGSD